MTSAWSTRRIGDLGRVVTGKTPSTKDPDNFGGPFPFVTIPDLDGRVVLDKTQRTLSTKGAQVIKTSLIPAGAVLISCIATVGKCGITAMPSFTNQQINSVIPDDECDARFLYYAFTQLGYELEAAGGGGSVYTNVSKSRFSDMELSLPTLHEQRAIAHLLGTLDDKIELNRRMNETLEEMARVLFKSWVVDFDPVRAKSALKQQALRGDEAEAVAAPASQESEWTVERARAYLATVGPQIADLFPDRLVDSALGEIPEGWEVSKLGNVIQINDSRRIPLNSRQRADRQGPYPYYGAAGIMDYVDDFLFDGVYVLTGEDGSVIDAHGRPVVQYVWGQFWVNNHAHVLRGRKGVSEDHLFLLLKQANLLPFVTGAVQPKLSQRNLKSVPIIYPGRSLCKEFSDTIAPFFEYLRDKADETEMLASQRDALLPKLIAGEISIG